MDQLTAMRHFIQVVETGSFSAAAKLAHTTQATISKRIAALEEQLGLKLLIRSSRQQSLTEVGQQYYQRCIAIIDAVNEADNLANTHATFPRGTLRITASEDFTQHILLPITQEFMTLYPEINIELIMDSHQRDLIAEGIDLAIRAGSVHDKSLIIRSLCSNPLHTLATPEYLTKHGTPQHPDDLWQHQCLLYTPQEPATHWPYIVDHEIYSAPVQGRFRCDNGRILMEMLLQSAGIGLAPQWMAHQYLQSGHLVSLLDQYRPQDITVRIVYPERKYLPLKTRYFIDYLVQRAKQHPALQF